VRWFERAQQYLAINDKIMFYLWAWTHRTQIMAAIELANAAMQLEIVLHRYPETRRDKEAAMKRRDARRRLAKARINYRKEVAQ
jgi:hypothetical protein